MIAILQVFGGGMGEGGLGPTFSCGVKFDIVSTKVNQNIGFHTDIQYREGKKSFFHSELDYSWK